MILIFSNLTAKHKHNLFLKNHLQQNKIKNNKIDNSVVLHLLFVFTIYISF